MGVEALSRGVADRGIEERREEGFSALVCRGAEVLASTEKVLGHPSGGRARVVDDVLARLPVTRVVHHGQEILAAACRDALDGEPGKRTARVITGSVVEEVTRGLVVTGTVLGIGGAIASGGSAVLVGSLGAAGYFLLPGVARLGAEALIDRLDGMAKKMGVELQRRLNPP